MKRTVAFLLAILCLFGVFSVYASAEDISEESEVVVFEESPNKKFTWVYILIGVLSVSATVAAAVVISKKVK